MPQLPTKRIRTLQDLAAFEAEMPLEARLPEGSILDVLVGTAERLPDRDAFVQLLTGAPDESPRRVTYRELLHLVRRTANLFASIYKPELRRDAARRVVLELLRGTLALPDADVQVSEGGRRGMRVRVTLPSSASGVVSAVESALSPFLFEVEITLR